MTTRDAVLRARPAIGALVLATALSACSAGGSISFGSSGLSASKMSALVTTVTTQEGFTAKSVSCPSGVPQRKGLVSACTAHYANGETAGFRVTQTDGNGAVTAGPAEMTAPAIENDIRSQFLSQHQLTVTASCPDHVAIVAGNHFNCTARSGSQSVAVPVKITDAHGGWTLV